MGAVSFMTVSVVNTNSGDIYNPHYIYTMRFLDSSSKQVGGLIGSTIADGQLPPNSNRPLYYFTNSYLNSPNGAGLDGFLSNGVSIFWVLGATGGLESSTVTDESIRDSSFFLAADAQAAAALPTVAAPPPQGTYESIIDADSEVIVSSNASKNTLYGISPVGTPSNNVSIWVNDESTPRFTFTPDIWPNVGPHDFPRVMAPEQAISGDELTITVGPGVGSGDQFRVILGNGPPPVADVFGNKYFRRR